MTTKVHIQLFHGVDADAYRLRFLAGLEPDESPYGFHHARDEGFEVTFSKDSPGRSNHALKRMLTRVFHFDVLHAFHNRKLLGQADVIWTMTEGEAFAVALMFALRIIKRKPIISNAVWLLNIWSTLSIWHRIIYKFLYRYLSVLTVHSRECLTVAQRCFPSLNIKLMQFGINIDVFKITKPSYESAGGVTRLLAAGHDRTRDWHTLLLAFGNDDRFHLTLVCPWLTNEQIADYRNVALVRSPTMSRFLELYRDADFVAVPMKSNIFSGITVALEAVALGRPVLCSRTGGVPTYFGEDEIFYTPVDDAEAMRQTILSAGPEERYRKASAAQHRFIESDYSTRAVVRHYASLTRSLEVA